MNIIKKYLPKEDFEKVKFVINYVYESGNKLKIPSEFQPDKEVCKVLSRTEAICKSELIKCFVTEFKDGEEGEIIANYLDR